MRIHPAIAQNYSLPEKYGMQATTFCMLFLGAWFWIVPFMSQNVWDNYFWWFVNYGSLCMLASAACFWRWHDEPQAALWIAGIAALPTLVVFACSVFLALFWLSFGLVFMF